MRYGPEHNDATRERILDAASRLFREHGVAAVGLAKVMGEADLTVGTFYTHFESKEALVQQVVRRSLAARHEELSKIVDLDMAIRAYLSPEHRDAVGAGCPIAALAPEVARHARATREALVRGLEPSLDLLAVLLAERRGTKVSQADAAAFFGLLSGTLQLARATPQRAKSDAILEAGIRAALALA